MNNRSELKLRGPLLFALLFVSLAMVLGVFSLPGASAQQQAVGRVLTRVPTMKRSPTRTPTKTRKPTRTATRPPTRTRRPTISPTVTITLTITQTPTLEFTLSPTLTPTWTNTPTGAITATRTLTSVPGADFVGAPLSGPAPLTVQFTQLNFSMLESCTWDFGDGTSQSFNIFTATPSNGSPYYSGCPSVTHVYSSAGVYDVSLSVVKYGTGARNSLLRQAYITVSEPEMTTMTPTPTVTPTPSITPTPRCFDCP